MRKTPTTDYKPNQVVFIHDDSPNQPLSIRPAKIILKSGYGTYKVKFYGEKDDSYASQYMIQEYNDKIAYMLANNNGSYLQLELNNEKGSNLRNKQSSQIKSQTRRNKNKKLMKFLKSAEKDHEIFIKNVNNMENKYMRICKQQQSEFQEQANNQQPMPTSKKGSASNRTSQNRPKTKYQAIEAIKISTLISDYSNTPQKQTIFSYDCKGADRVYKESSKHLLMTKLQWAIQDVYYQQFNQKTEQIIYQIMQSEIIQPVQYVTVRRQQHPFSLHNYTDSKTKYKLTQQYGFTALSIYDKIGKSIQILKKDRKSNKLKNYLTHKQQMILKGFENYLNNYSMFLRAREGFEKFLSGNTNSYQIFNQNSNLNISESYIYMEAKI